MKKESDFMAMVLHTKGKRYCATCQWCDDSCVKNYDPRSGNMTVDNSGSDCSYKNKKVLPSSSACPNYKPNMMY